jgi:uncharacterized protein (DUF736 family)
MAYEQRPVENGTIFLSLNDSDNPKAPLFRGKGKDDQGRDIEIAMWEGKSRAGKEWVRIKIGPPYQSNRQREGIQEMRQAVDRNVSDVPTPPPAEDDVPF